MLLDFVINVHNGSHINFDISVNKYSGIVYCCAFVILFLEALKHLRDV